MKTCHTSHARPRRKHRHWMLLAFLWTMTLASLSWADWPKLGELSDIVYANNRFVAIGPTGKLYWSNDGNTWTKSSYTGREDFAAVVHTGTQFVAAANNGTLVKSSNGSSWSALSHPELEGSATALTYGQGVYVMVDSLGYIYASRDGIAWTTEFKPSANADEELYGVVYANNRFVAVGIHYDSDYDSYGLIRVSTTGFSWTRERQKVNEELYDICFAEGSFWAVGNRNDPDYNYYSQVLSSTTGTTWTQVTIPGEDTLHGITFGNNKLAAGGDGGVLAIRDGTAWTQRWSGSTTGMIAAVAYGAGKFVAVGKSGIEAISSDGLAWFGQTSKPTVDISSIVAGNELLISAGESLWISEDLKTWANTYYGPVTFEKAAYFNGLYLAIGSYYDYAQDNFMGVIVRSANGRTWEMVRNQASEELYGITYGKGLYMVVGYRESGDLYYDLILTSPDGRTWTSRSAGTGSNSFDLSSVQYGSNQFIAGSGYGGIVTSLDGINWRPKELEFSTSINDITYGQNQFVMVGSNGEALLSSNGSEWSQKLTGKTNNLESVIFHHDQLYVVGAGGLILKTKDFATWTPQPSGVTNSLTSLCVWQDQVWVAGQGGTILTLSSAQPEPALLEMKAGASAADSITLTIRGQAGSNHRLERSDRLEPNAIWVLEKSIQLGQDGTLTMTLPHEGLQRYYRCQAE